MTRRTAQPALSTRPARRRRWSFLAPPVPLRSRSPLTIRSSRLPIIYIYIYLYIFWCACLANNSVQRLCVAKLQPPFSPLLRFPLPFETYCHRLTRSPMWRIVTFTQTCGACSSTVFVPFALHKHFNSAVKAAVWFILCDGSVPAAPLVTSAEVRLGIRHALPLPFP